MVIAPPAPPAPDVELRQNIAHYQALAEDLAVTIAQTEVMQRQIDTLKKKMKERRVAVGRLASASYRTYRADSLNVLLDAGSAGEVRDRLLVLNVFAQHRQLEIKELAVTAERYAATQRTLDSLVAQQRTQQRELTAQRLKIEAKLAELRRPKP
ncbi:MAG TPA: hypothetical protein DGT23_15200 [Micromonosporaceae bacterium]|nr:hypothetical protein [Micromonosporaceae bacterium]